jgi:phosphatidylinositol alpha-1,6-mannosyltransferase
MSRGCDRLVCGHVAQLPVAWLVRLRRPKLRYYVVAHGIDVWRRFSLIERIALRGAERVFCVSAFTRSELLRNCRLRADKVVVLPNALDPYFEIQAGRPLAECGPTILAVSRLTYEDRYKGVEHLIPALATVRATLPHARLRIIGQGDDLRRLQGIARRAGLQSDAVEFLGYVDDQRLKAELANCRLLALPSEHEGFGLVFIEAMAQGRPCLGARSGGTPEVITSETGILVEFGNVSAIAAGCVAALQRDWNQTAILERARYFSYDSFKDRLAALLPVRSSPRS